MFKIKMSEKIEALMHMAVVATVVLGSVLLVMLPTLVK